MESTFTTPRFEREKFRELVLYIAERSTEDRWFGAVKLNKLLYFCDFNAYACFGRSITGATYQHLREGPAPRAMVPIQSELTAAAEARIESRVLSPLRRQQARLVALRPARTALFSPAELAMVDEIIDVCRDLTGSKLSELSHEELGWRLTSDGQDIPYETALLDTEPLDAAEIAEAQGIAQSLGLLAAEG